MVEQGISENQAYGKIYDEVYRDELKRINELTMKKQLADVELFFKTGQVFTLLELETWTEEMLDFYKSTIGDAGFKRIKEQIQNDNIVAMIEEVAEDTSAHASFMTQNNVSATIDPTMAKVLSSDGPCHSNSSL